MSAVCAVVSLAHVDQLLLQLRSVRRSIPDDAMCTLVHAFVTSRVDYCNAVLYGVSAKVARRLQAVLPAAARLITVFAEISTSLRDTLHWLPMSWCIVFKIALMAFDCVHSQGPGYFDGIITPVHTFAARDRLQSADQGNVVVPGSRTTRFNQSSFSSVAPTMWNDLPLELKNRDIGRQCFKHNLKTWLYDSAYS